MTYQNQCVPDSGSTAAPPFNVIFNLSGISLVKYFSEMGSILCKFLNIQRLYMSHIMRKSAFLICGNKGADKLYGKHAADQRLGFPYIDSTIPLLPKSKISSI